MSIVVIIIISLLIIMIIMAKVNLAIIKGVLTLRAASYAETSIDAHSLQGPCNIIIMMTMRRRI